MKRLIKVLIIAGILLAGFLLLLFLGISPAAKYIIEKKSEEWIGRKIKIESLWINIFTGSFHIENFKLYENKSDKVFIRFADFYCNIEVLKIISGKYAVSPISLTSPEINIIETGSKFNFDDLIKRFADTTNKKSEAPSEPVKYSIENFSINSGIIHYSTTVPVTAISIIDLNISTASIASTDSNYIIKSDLRFESGGKIKTLLSVNANSLEYNLHLNTEDHMLNFLTAYMKDYLKVKSFDASLNSDLNISGNFNKPQEIAASGNLKVNNFSVIDTTGEKLTSFESFIIDIDSLNTKAGIYNFNNIDLDHPYLKFGIYNDGTNFDRVIVEEEIDSTAAAPIEKFSNIFQMIAGYVKTLSADYLLKEYRIDKLNLHGGHIIFTDYTLEDKFQYDLDSMNLNSNNIFSKNDRIKIALSSRLNKSGITTGTLSINPDGYDDMEIYYKVSDLLISDINPYSKYYVATPFINGNILFENKTKIVNNQLKSTNKLFIENIKVGGKSDVKGLYDLPVKLAVAILRDSKGNIDFEIPVEGDLNDPSYKLGKAIWQVFKNLIIKAATAPYNLIANAFGGKEDDYKEIRFEYLQKQVTEDQEKTLNHLAKLITDKPDLGIEFVQLNNKEDEIEKLAIYNSKKQYFGYISIDSLTAEQHKNIIELSNKDSIFVNWVDSTLGMHQGITSIQEKCIKRIGKEKLVTEVNLIMEQRNSFLRSYFTGKGIPAESIKINNVKNAEQAAKESMPKYLVNLIFNESAAEGGKTAKTSDKIN